MNFKLKQHQKILFVFSFLFLYLFNPLNTVSADTLRSNGEAVIIGVTDPIINQTKYGCAVSSLNGVLGGTITGIVKVIGADFAVTQCDIARGAIFPDAGGTGYIYNPSDGNPNNSLLGLTMNASQLMISERPASGVDFIQDKVYALTNFGSVSAQDPSTYYPGAGSDLLRPIQSFWGWSVNFVFSFLILLILAIAFAIIFRQRLGGKADVTIQNSIPNIAMALVLVPLSYAISGLFIDAVTIGTNAVHGFLIGPGAPGSQVYQTRNDDGSCLPFNPGDITTESCDRGFYVDDDRVNIWNVRGRISIGDEVGNAIGTTISAGTTDGAVGIILGVFRAIDSIVGILTGGSSAQFAWLGSIINFFVSLLTLWISLKIAWALFKKFLTFLIFPIFSPFIFATVALPGNGLSAVVKYSKIMGAASLSFIVTYMMFILTIVFTSEGFQSQFPDIRTGGYIPPLLGLESVLSGATDTQGGGITALILTLVGIGIFFTIPNVLAGIDKALDAEFAIPQFVKDPLVNMRESFGATYGVASRGVGLARTTTSGVINTARGLQDGKGLLNRFNARRQLAYDNSLGLNASDKGSARNAKYTELSQKRQGANAEIEEGRKLINRPGATAQERAEGERLIAKGQKTLGKVSKEAELFDIKGFYGDDVKAPQFKATVDLNANFAAPLNLQAVAGFKAAANLQDPPYDIPIGKLVFEADQFEFEKGFTIMAYVAGSEEDDPEGKPEGPAISINAANLATGVQVSSFGKMEKGAILAELVLQQTEVSIKPNQFKVGLVLRVLSSRFFNDDGVNGTPTGYILPNALNPRGVVDINPKLRFSYNSLYSGQVNVVLKSSGIT